jgi:DNA-binding transcriptional ArsR family regulator
VTVESILHALSDPVRIQILKGILRSNSPKTCSDFLNMPDRAIPKSTLSQHFRILREAGLIRSERKGVEMRNTPRCKELSPRFGSMIREILAAYAEEYARAAKQE